jgi:hypothetical protein
MKPKPVNFQRTVTNVGEGAATYNARVDAKKNFDVMVKSLKGSMRRKRIMSLYHLKGDYNILVHSVS